MSGTSFGLVPLSGFACVMVIWASSVGRTESIKALTGVEIAKMAPCSYVGRNLRNNSIIKGDIRKDGTITVKGAGGSDAGSWWISGDKFCRKFKIALGGKTECFAVHRGAATFSFVSSTGQKVSTVSCRGK